MATMCCNELPVVRGFTGHGSAVKALLTVSYHLLPSQRIATHVQALPSAGDALLFYSYRPRLDVNDHQNFWPRGGSIANATASTEAEIDPAALHGGCPVTGNGVGEQEVGAKIEKWIATRWFRSARIRH